MSEPAFPGVAGEDGFGNCTYQDLPDGGRVAIVHNQGMTLLDYFAGQVAAGLNANPQLTETPLRRLAELAYDGAQAMLDERAKRG